jgi:hypothetical protein
LDVLNLTQFWVFWVWFWTCTFLRDILVILGLCRFSL